MKFNKKRATGLLSLVMVGAIGVTSLAIFTDRSQSTATAKAGSLDLQLTQTWAADNEEALKTFIPGDILDLEYTLTNDSTLAAKVREKFVISSDKEIPANTFQIFKKSQLQQDTSTGIWSVKDGESPVEALVDTAWNDAKGTMYSTYTLPQFVLDGTHKDQQGFASQIATPNTDASADAKVYANTSDVDHYVILFDKDAVTSVSGANISVKYLAEAMQHSGTGAVGEDDLWNTVVTEEYTIMPGVTKAAPELTFDPLIP